MTDTAVLLDRRTMTLRRRFPSVADLEGAARRKIPRFALDYLEGGTGSEIAITRNRSSIDSIEIIPRYGKPVSRIASAIELFGRFYAAPIGVAPVGLGGLIRPGAEQILASAAQKARLPYVLSTFATASIEEIAKVAPDVFWFQLYAFQPEPFDVTGDLVRRAHAAGAHVLVVTLDVPLAARRSRDMRNGLDQSFRPGAQALLDIARRPNWAFDILRRGRPRFANFDAYKGAGRGAGGQKSSAFVSTHFNWDDIAKLRELWPRALVVKGLLHPIDAECALSVGVDGIIVSNHGGRQFDASPAAIDALPAIVAAVGDRSTLMFDSGIRSGLDILRALALGAKSTFAGRPFLASVAALGPEGGAYIMDMLQEEFRTALGQAGLVSPEEARICAASSKGVRTAVARSGPCDMINV